MRTVVPAFKHRGRVELEHAMLAFLPGFCWEWLLQRGNGCCNVVSQLRDHEEERVRGDAGFALHGLCAVLVGS